MNDTWQNKSSMFHEKIKIKTDIFGYVVILFSVYLNTTILGKVCNFMKLASHSNFCDYKIILLFASSG